MALEKTWYSWVDAAIADVASNLTLCKATLWALKAALKGELTGVTLGHTGAIPSGARWTCVGSSDSVAAGMDSVDRWGATYDATKIVRNAAGVHSWIVLQSPAAIAGAGGAWFLTIDYNGSQDYTITYALSRTLPTGGTTSARPTSTNEVAVAGRQFQDNNTWVATGGRIHFCVETNGAFWFFASKNGSGIIYAAIGVQPLKNLRVAGDTWPICAFVQGGSVQALADADNLFFCGGTTGVISTRAYNPTGPVLTASVATVLAYKVSTSTLTAAQAGAFFADGKFETLPLIVCTTTAGVIGLKGELYDAAAIASEAAVGARFPAAGSIESIVVGDVLAPLNAVPTL